MGTGKGPTGPSTPLQEQVSASTRATLPARSGGRVGPWVATASPDGAGCPRGCALSAPARERPATPAGQGAPCLPLGARGAGGSARKLVSPASQKLAASGLQAPRKQLQTRVGRVETCCRGTHQSKLQKP